MKVTLLDTQTGRTAESSGLRTFDWEDGNWSCDCNRQLSFDEGEFTGRCIGGTRYIVIKAEVEDERDWETTLFDLNADYPRELLEAHGIEEDESPVTEVVSQDSGVQCEWCGCAETTFRNILPGTQTPVTLCQNCWWLHTGCLYLTIRGVLVNQGE